MSDALKKAAEELDKMVETENESWVDRLVKSLANPRALLTKGGVSMPAETENKVEVGHEKTETGAKEPEPKDTGGKKPEGSKDIKADAGDGGKGEGKKQAGSEGSGPTPVGGGEGGEEDLERDADGNLIVAGKRVSKTSAGGDVVPEGQKKDDAKVQGGDAASRDALSRKSLEPGQYEVIDADSLAEILNDLGQRLAKSEAETKAVRTENAELKGMIETMTENLGAALAAMAKSQGAIMKSLEAQPAKLPQPGVMGVVGRTGVRTDAAKTKLTKSQVQVAIENGYREDKVDRQTATTALAILDSRGPDAAIAAVPADVAKSLGLSQ